MTRRLPVLALLLFCSCGGRYDDPSDQQTQLGAEGNPSESAGAGGVGASAPQDSGRAGNSVGGDGPDAAPPTCPTTWWGGTLQGVTGATTCRDPWDPAMLASFHLEWPEGSTLEGPLASKIEAPFVMCQYRSKTPYDAEASVWWTTLPYFGPGYPETIIPSGVVSSALQRCASPKTMAPGGGLVQLAHYAIGTWLRCPGGDTQGWGWSGDGVVLRADGTWHTLQLESDGRLSLTTECLQGGLWGFVENDAIPSTMGQINFMTETGEWMTIETFYNHGTRMTIESMADFVRAQ